MEKYPYLIEFIQALNDEIKVLEQRGESEIRVSAGKLTKIDSGEYVYSFVTEEAVFATDDQPVEISYQGKRYKAVLVGKSGNTVLVATNDNLGEEIGIAVLIISPIYLIKALISVLEQLPKMESYNFNFPHSIVGKKSLPEVSTKSTDKKVDVSKLNKYQLKAINQALGSKLTFIWGPPGTGKTTVIGKIVEALLREKQRVLITSHTNIAVDTALKDVIEKSGKLNEGIKVFYEQGQILRYGVHQLPSLDKYPMIFGQNIVSKSSEDLLSKLLNIDTEEAKLTHENKDIEGRIDAARLLKHIIDQRDKLEERVKRLKEELEQERQSLLDKQETDSLIKGQLDKARQNNWLTNFVQGLNVDKLLGQLNENKRLIDYSQEQINRITEEIKTSKAKLGNITAELSQNPSHKEVETNMDYAGKLESNLSKIDGLRSERRSIQEQLDQMSKLVLNSARAVATTLTKCYLRLELLTQPFDVVIVDEISMAQIPLLFVAMGMGQKIILVGDFLQLPPIVQADTDVAKKWLSKSLYDYFEIPQVFLRDNAWPDQVRPLFRQYRMHPDISGLVNDYVYKGRLENDEGTKLERAKNMHRAPFKGHVAFFNTGDINAYCRMKEGGSRFTLKNAFLDLMLACGTVQDYLRDKDLEEDERADIVGVVTPYRAQANLTSKLLSDIKIPFGGKKPQPLANFVEVNTVHRFQGNQRQVIVFDTTDDFPMFRPAPMVDDSDEDGEDIKLINVAVTRAKDKFLLLGNKNYIQKKHSESSLIKRMLPLIEEVGPTLTFNPKDKEDEIIDITEFKDFKDLAAAINASSMSIQAVFSDLFENEIFKRLRDTLLQARQRGLEVKLFTQLSSLYSEEYAKVSEERIDQLKEAGIDCHLRSKFRDYFLILDRQVIYCFIDEQRLSGIGIKSEKGAKELARLFGLDDSDEIRPCPECQKSGRNGVIVHKQSRFGAFYACSLYPKCKYIDRKKKENMESGNTIDKSECPKCGKPLAKKRSRYGMFWGCTGYPECRYIAK
ncbi:MAG: topoisomerase DNA-binding C4 zinc finger domain-containing protein [Candidatus Blackburnbacteria bacterium]|nr:topoisomerase DNA-binding C4 zinc finger domain-containing protein [Candidatus Blackburnbacteria bacterium]